ncbi:MAG: sulfite exporter TauE/SafE family protein [Gammaproteobacteria bacterium]|nr:MAG: sulfite exporter TauE/SafE family protein [Gammaproteobacteria bacterium]
MSAAASLGDVGMLSVWLLGISVGFTTCTAVCLPYLGTWALSRGEGGGVATMDTAAFAAGKVAAYTLLGGMAGIMGEILITFLKGGIGHWLIGMTAVVSGLWLMWPRQAHFSCSARYRAASASPFFMGFALSFTPCTPLAALLAASAITSDGLLGSLYGFLFGLGAAFTPLFLVIPLLGSFGRALQAEQPWIGKWLLRMGGAALMAIGLYRIFLST